MNIAHCIALVYLVVHVTGSSVTIGILQSTSDSTFLKQAQSLASTFRDNVTFLGLYTDTYPSDSYDNLLFVHKALQTSNVDVVLGDYNPTFSIASESLSIPYVVLDREEPHFPRKPHLIHMSPPFSAYIDATTDLVEYFTWRRLVVFYDIHNSGTVFVEALLLEHRYEIQAYNMHSPLENRTSSSVNDILKDARSRGFHNFVVLASMDKTVELLRQALYLSMMSQQFKWLVVNIHSKPVQWGEFLDTQANITDLRMIYNWSGSKVCGGSMEDNLRNDAINVSVAVARLRNEDGYGKNCAVCSKISLAGCTGMLTFSSDGSRNDRFLQIFTLTGLAEGTMGTWNGNRSTIKQRVDFTYNTNVRETDSPFGRRPVVITTIIEKPFVQWKSGEKPKYMEDREPIDVALLEGFLIDLIADLATMLNFEYVIYICPDGKFGSKKWYGWTGMVNELLHKNADFALAPFSITPERAAVVDFTAPYMIKGTATIIKAPVRHVATFQFLAPLSTHVWISVFAAYICASCVLFILAKFNMDKHQNYLFTIKEMCWYTWGTLLRGSLTLIPKALSSRVLIATWWFFSLIMISVYTANLAAFLTITSINLPMNSARELAKQNEYIYGTVEDSQIEKFFNNTKLQDYTAMAAKMNIQRGKWSVRRVEHGLKRVITEKYAFLWDSPTLRYMIQDNCDLMEIGNPFDLKGYGFPTVKNAPFLDDLSWAILKLSDDGVTRKMEKKWWGKSGCGAPKQSATSASIGLRNALGIFIVLISGVVLSLIYCGLRNHQKIVAFIRSLKSKQKENKHELQEMSIAAALGNHYEPIVKFRAWSPSRRKKFDIL